MMTLKAVQNIAYKSMTKVELAKLTQIHDKASLMMMVGWIQCLL